MLSGGYSEEGFSSWYGVPFHGRRAANGEIYDMHKLTAAHRTLPFESIVRVTNLTNGRISEVRILRPQRSTNCSGEYRRGYYAHFIVTPRATISTIVSSL